MEGTSTIDHKMEVLHDQQSNGSPLSRQVTVTSTYTNGQKANSNHVVATWSLTMTELTCSVTVLSKTIANPFAHYF